MKKLNTMEMRNVEGGAYPIGTVRGTCLTCGTVFYQKPVIGYTLYSKALKAVQTKGKEHVKNYKPGFGCYGWKTKLL